MNQSSVIGAALVIAYVIFVITKGELPCYMQTLGIASAAGCPPNLQPAGCSGAAPSASSSGSGAAPVSPGGGGATPVAPGGGRMIGIPIPRITVPGSQTY